MDDQHVIVFGVVHDFLEKIQINDLRGRVVGIGNDEHLWPRPGLFGGVDQVLEKITARTHGNSPDITAGNDGGIGVNRIGGIGGKDHITRPNG